MGGLRVSVGLLAGLLRGLPEFMGENRAGVTLGFRIGLLGIGWGLLTAAGGLRWVGHSFYWGLGLANHVGLILTEVRRRHVLRSQPVFVWL